MYSFPIPIFYDYWRSQPMIMPNNNSYPNCYIPSPGCLQSPFHNIGLDNPNLEFTLNQRDSPDQDHAMASDKKILIKKKKKNLSSRWKQGDEEFKQRQQTANRNLCSNTLKVYLKQARDIHSETFQSIARVIQLYKLDITSQSYLQKLNSSFPGNRTYVSFEKLKKMCGNGKQEQLQSPFGIVLRITFKRFFLHQIHMVCIKSVRTTRKIRNQQIKQGRMFLNQISQ